MKPFLITIDGPAGAGKTTVSQMLAQCLGYDYIDTGSLYRGIALRSLLKNVKPDDDIGLDNLCKYIDLQFIRNEKRLSLFLNGEDITEKIRTPEITMLASKVSARPVVRKHLLGLQRNLGKNKCAVFEGRDMGTVVFPDADIKFFLDASLKTRALRRHNDINSKKLQTLNEVKEDILRRDEADRNRTESPLKAADDAVIIDSTDLTAAGVVGIMLEHINEIRNTF